MIDSPRRRGFGHPDLVATLAVLGILAGMLLPAIQKVREAAAKATCTSNLRLLGLAVHTFHDTMNRLPKSCDYALDGMDTKTAPHATKKIEYPAGSSLYVDMLKYVEQVHQLDAGSKTGARNKLVAVKMFLCPSRRTASAGPKADYAHAFNPGWMGNDGGAMFPAAGTKIPIAAHPTVHAALNGLPAGTNDVTLGALADADGAAFTLLLAHKGIQPANYNQAATSFKDNDFRFDAIGSEVNPAIIKNNKRYPAVFALDANHESGVVPGTGMTAGAIMTSPHPRVMPTLWCDGSARDVAFNYSTKGMGGPIKERMKDLNSANTLTFLWGYNDSVKLDDLP